MKKFLAFTAIALMFTMSATTALSAQCAMKNQSQPVYSIFFGESNSYGIDVKTKKSSAFIGGVAGITVNPHDNWIARLTVGYFSQSTVGSLFKTTSKPFNADSADLIAPQKFSGLYFSIASPIDLSRRKLYFGAVIRIGPYRNGLTFSPGFYFGYEASRNLLPKSKLLVKVEPAVSLSKIENLVTVDAMIHVRISGRRGLL